MATRASTPTCSRWVRRTSSEGLATNGLRAWCLQRRSKRSDLRWHLCIASEKTPNSSRLRARATERITGLRSCPPSSACGLLLPLYFAPPGDPPRRSKQRPGARIRWSAAQMTAGEGVGDGVERSRGGGGGKADDGGHERNPIPNALASAHGTGPRSSTDRANQPFARIRHARPVTAHVKAWVRRRALHAAPESWPRCLATSACRRHHGVHAASVRRRRHPARAALQEN